MGSRTLAFSLCLAAAAVSAGACNTDPVHTSAVNALGPEAAGVPQGEFHRAGQPCLVCHGTDGPASQQFVIAGTVFFGPGTTANPVGVGNAQVVLEDDSQSQFVATTDCVGNFAVRPQDWSGHPQFPVIVRVVGTPEGSTLDVAMQSHVGRDGSCGSCHLVRSTGGDFNTPGIIHLAPQDDPKYQGDPTCPVNPVLSAGGGL
jgi:hypothetical protein